MNKAGWESDIYPHDIDFYFKAYQHAEIMSRTYKNECWEIYAGEAVSNPVYRNTKSPSRAVMLARGDYLKRYNNTKVTYYSEWLDCCENQSYIHDFYSDNLKRYLLKISKTASKKPDIFNLLCQEYTGVEIAKALKCNVESVYKIIRKIRKEINENKIRP